MNASEPPANPPAEPIALTVLTGFLGAGKTTLLQKLVADPALADAAVLINEVGEAALDHLFVEVLDERLLLLSSGCLCCAVRGDLLDSLENIAQLRDQGRVSFRRVVIETTGLADPAPLLHLVMTHPYLVQRYRLDGIVTVIDAVNGGATLDAHEEAVKQVAMADRLVLTKTDLLAVDRERLAALRARLKRLNPAAPVLDAGKGEATAETLLNAGLYDPSGKIPDVTRWLAEEAVAGAESAPASGLDPHRHDERIRVFTIATEAAIPLSTLEGFLELLRATHGEKLLRLKGIVRIAEEPDQPLVLHAVQQVLHPPARLPRWPDEDRRSRLVCVTRDLEPSVVQRLLNAFLGIPTADTPDRAALTANPLAIRPGAQPG